MNKSKSSATRSKARTTKANANTVIPSVTITFDGLMLACFRDVVGNKRCDLKFCAADDHQMNISVFKRVENNGTAMEQHLTHEMLFSYRQLWLYKEGHGSQRDYRNTGDASKGVYYQEILELDGPKFYGSNYQGRPFTIEGDKYGPTLTICDGAIGTQTQPGQDCHQIVVIDDEIVRHGVKYSSEVLRFDLSTNDWWVKKTYFSDLIRPLTQFSRWVTAELPLSAGDNLILMAEAQNGALTPFNLVPQYNGTDNYWLHISHLDLHTPTTVDDCQGLAHLSESVVRDGRAVLGVFAPSSARYRPSPPWRPQLTASSEVTCCEMARCSNFEET